MWSLTRLISMHFVSKCEAVLRITFTHMVMDGVLKDEYQDGSLIVSGVSNLLKGN